MYEDALAKAAFVQWKREIAKRLERAAKQADDLAIAAVFQSPKPISHAVELQKLAARLHSAATALRAVRTRFPSKMPQDLREEIKRVLADRDELIRQLARDLGQTG